MPFVSCNYSGRVCLVGKVFSRVWYIRQTLNRPAYSGIVSRIPGYVVLRLVWLLGVGGHGFLYYPSVGYTRVRRIVTRVLPGTYPTKHAFEATAVKSYQVHRSTAASRFEPGIFQALLFQASTPPPLWFFTPARLKCCLLLASSSSISMLPQASARKERLQWNKERTLLSRKVAEAEARAREASDGVASPEEVRDQSQSSHSGPLRYY